MNHVNDCETGNMDMVVSIKKSETIDLMDYTDSGVQGLSDICRKYVRNRDRQKHICFIYTIFHSLKPQKKLLAMYMNYYVFLIFVNDFFVSHKDDVKDMSVTVVSV